MANDNTSPPNSNSNAKIQTSQRESTLQKKGKTCHQCRQKILDKFVGCTKVKANTKKCTLHWCKPCLYNRYTEIAEKAVESGNWSCPKCRDICNCSHCMRKKGLPPTGVFVRNVKGKGPASTSNGGTLKRRRASENETDEPMQKRIKEEAAGESEVEKSMTEDDDVAIQLPQGTELTKLAGIDMPSGDTGNALRLLEFCETFGEDLELQKGQPQILLRELTSVNVQNGNEPLIIQFHVKLLSLIDEDTGKKYRELWMEGFRDCIAESDYPLKESFLEVFNLQPHEYGKLNFSERLMLLNFLCDEALGSVGVRTWLKRRNEKEQKNMRKNLIAAARSQEKKLKKKVQDKVVKPILSHKGVSFSIAEKIDLFTKIRADIATTLADSLIKKESCYGQSSRKDIG